jgi:Flp pilus assembly protein TadB
MMLDRDDHRRLEEIERRLEREDPVLARALREGSPGGRTWQGVTLVVVGALLALLGLVVFSLSLVAVGVACAAGGAALTRTRRSRGVQRRSE